MVASPPPGSASSRRPGWARSAEAPFRVAPPSRRASPLLLMVAVLVILAFGALGALLYLRAGERVEVLAAARTIPVGHRIVRADLRAVRISVDPGTTTIPVAATGQALGKAATTTLLPGMLLTPQALAPTAAPGPGRSIIGLELAGAQLPLPADQLAPGAAVQLIRTPPRESTAPVGGPDQVETDTVLAERAEVYSVQRSAAGDSVHVAVLVDRQTAPVLLRVAAAGQVGLAVLPAGGP